jgi:hypothetical protein
MLSAGTLISVEHKMFPSIMFYYKLGTFQFVRYEFYPVTIYIYFLLSLPNIILLFLPYYFIVIILGRARIAQSVVVVFHAGGVRKCL